jgi:hypothetical protein
MNIDIILTLFSDLVLRNVKIFFINCKTDGTLEDALCSYVKNIRQNIKTIHSY